MEKEATPVSVGGVLPPAELLLLTLRDADAQGDPDADTKPLSDAETVVQREKGAVPEAPGDAVAQSLGDAEGVAVPLAKRLPLALCDAQPLALPVAFPLRDSGGVAEGSADVAECAPVALPRTLADVRGEPLRFPVPHEEGLAVALFRSDGEKTGDALTLPLRDADALRELLGEPLREGAALHDGHAEGEPTALLLRLPLPQGEGVGDRVAPTVPLALPLTLTGLAEVEGEELALVEPLAVSQGVATPVKLAHALAVHSTLREGLAVGALAVP